MTAQDHPRSGYVLIVVAVIVAMLALFAVMAARVQGQLSGSVTGLREQALLERDAQNAVARIAFLLTTEPMGGRSILVGGEPGSEVGMTDGAVTSATGRRIVEILLDDTPYRWRASRSRDLLVSVQDENGLININGGDEIGIKNLIQVNGASENVAAVLASALADFVDADDLRRHAGAERGDYARVGEPPPPDHAISSPWSALEAMGWRSALSPRARDRLFTMVRAGGVENVLNVNTAPLNVVRAAYNLSERDARVVVQRRRNGVFRAADEVTAFTGEMPRAEAPTPTTMPGNVFRVTVQPSGRATIAQRALEVELVLGAGQDDRPIYWRGGWLRRATSEATGEAREAAILPEGAAVSAP